jgi:hypothetical protein
VIRYERDSDQALWAVAEVVVGTRRVGFRVPLGAWPGDAPGPGGLLGLPVVVLPPGSPTRPVLEGAARSGRATAAEVIPDGPGLLAADAEVLVVRDGNGRVMNLVRALGGRPLPALPSSDPGAIHAFLDGCHVDLDIAIPVVDEDRRAALRASLAPLRSEGVHHLVEVDPRPVREPAAVAPEDALDPALWSAAAGVLAGRLAAGRRHWLTDRS